jgi:hypothetical protein
MKKIILLCCSVSLSLSLLAQIPEDAIKFSWQPVNGTARINAVGGAMGSLGGDITAISVNPAGLAFFKGSDLVFSPGMLSLNNKSKFRGTNASQKENQFNVGPSGIVFGLQERGRWDNKAISIAVTRTANFKNNIYYEGFNDFSSYGEQYAIDASTNGASYQNILNYDGPVSIGTRMAFYSFFLDTIQRGTGYDWVSMAMYDQLRNGGDFYVKQSHRIETKGGITEIALGYAASMDDKIYVGGSLGIDVVSYTKNSIFREEDATGNNMNYFNYSQLTETFTTKGFGLNLKLGVIAKPSERVRLGFAVHSPTVYTLKDTYDASMTNDGENSRTPGNEITTVQASQVVADGILPVYKYEMYTPWKMLVSGSYVLREISDVKKQKGFLTADIEYAHYRMNRYRNPEDAADPYYKGVNTAIKDYYKGAFNFRVGGELKFTTLMTRLGFAYYGNPYKDKELKGNKMYISGGLGYRNKGMFIDVTYVHGLQKDVVFPYRLSDKANTFASTKTTGGNVMLTLGFKI